VHALNATCAAHRPARGRPDASRRPHQVSFCPMMTRRLAQKNIRTGLIVSAICMFMFGLSFIVASLYIS
jgi:hypothetical protein